ncbi:MAG: endonuclease III [Fimbriimonadaceae bacterium]|nr:endonuclease III [Fimbriimonadaceae bacterium]
MPRRKWNPNAIATMLADLEGLYGSSRFIPRFSPMDELVSCMLSQHTTDVNSFPAFTRLLERFGTYEMIARAPVDTIAETIRGAGLANSKAKHLRATLGQIGERFGEITLEPLRWFRTEAARDWLTELPGVGPKTASIVLCFAFGRESIPVDTHVFRVGWRLGLFPERMGEVRAHDALLKLVPAEHAFAFHTLLIQHGRMTCRAPLPNCERCPLTDRCAYWRSDGPGKRARALARSRKRSAAKRPAANRSASREQGRSATP